MCSTNYRETKWPPVDAVKLRKLRMIGALMVLVGMLYIPYFTQLHHVFVKMPPPCGNYYYFRNLNFISLIFV